MNTYYARFTQQYKIVLALIVPAVIVVPSIYLIAKYFPNLPEGALWAVIFGIVVLPILISLYLVKLLTPLVEVKIYHDAWQFNFPAPGLFTPNNFEIKPMDITDFAVEVARNGYYFTITANVAPYRFSISAASNSDEDAQQLMDLIGKTSAVINTQNTQPKELKIKVTALRNMRWFWAMIIFSVIFFVVVMVIQLLKG